MRFVKYTSDIGAVAKQIVSNAVTSFAGPMDKQLLTDLGDQIIDYDLDDFVDDLYEFLNQYQQTTGEFKDFTFNASYAYSVPLDSEQNALRFHVIERTDASTQGGVSNPHTGRRNYKWMLYNTIDDLQNPGYKVLTFVKPMDNTIELVSWSKNYRDANKFALQIEDLLDTYSYLFKAKGLIDLRFLGRRDDLFYQTTSLSWYGCPMRYYIKTFKIKLVYEKLLEQLTIDFLLASDPNSKLNS